MPLTHVGAPDASASTVACWDWTSRPNGTRRSHIGALKGAPIRGYDRRPLTTRSPALADGDAVGWTASGQVAVGVDGGGSGAPRPFTTPDVTISTITTTTAISTPTPPRSQPTRDLLAVAEATAGGTGVAAGVAAGVAGRGSTGTAGWVAGVQA